MFLAKNISPTFELFKKCKPFSEDYPEWYKHNEIARQMKNIVKFYSNPIYEDIDYKFLSPEIMDDFVELTLNLLDEELKLKGVLK